MKLRELYATYRRFTIFHFFHYLMKNKLKKIQAIFSGIALDIGCGEKPYLHCFKNLSAYWGTNSMIYYKHQIVDKFTNCYINDGTYLPFKAESIDNLFCFQVLPVFKDITIFLNEVNRILKKNGYLLLTTDFLYPIWNPPNNFWRTTNFGLQYLMDQTSFKVLSIEPFGGFWIMLARVFDSYYSSLLSIFLNNVKHEKRYIVKIYHFLKFVLFLFIGVPLQPIIVNFLFVICLILDKLAYNSNYTTNYLVLAQKRN